MSSLRKDLISISCLSSENFSRILSIASKADQTSIDWALYLEKVDDESREPSLALFRILNYIGNAFSDARDFDKEISKLDEFVSSLISDNKDAESGWNRIRSSYNELNDFFLNKKEEFIKARFSNVTESSITVDARAIFSMDRTSIERYLFPYILKLTTCDEKSFLCEFYPEQLELLEKEIKNAKQKRSAIEEKITGKNINHGT